MLYIIEKDEDGYWAYSKKGYCFEEMGYGCHTAHEDNQLALLEVIRTLEPCNCNECLK